MWESRHRRLAAGLLTVILAGCGLFPKIDETRDWSADRFYTEAKEAIADGNYTTAIGYLEKLQARYPFGRYAQQAQLELTYAYYKSDEPDAAIAAADRFIKTNPRNPYVDYAYYLKGMVNFDRGESVATRLFPLERSRVDTSVIQQAYNDFSELVRKFPNSKYAEDARKRILFLHNALGTYELNVADFYMQRGAYVAAVNRAAYVLENYARTPAVADALAVMTEGYVYMGMLALAADSLRVLQQNHPDSPRIPDLTALVNGERRSRSLVGAP
jgi:outer membrane protein assembly factor BamD